MTKIYEALSQHAQRRTPEGVRAPSSLSGGLFVANSEMQSLYRSIEALITDVQGGAVIMFSSARPGEGKTTICGSFAVTLAEKLNKSVLILDGDRDHALSRSLGSPGETTMSSLANSPEAVLQSAKPVGPRGLIVAVPMTSSIGFADPDSPELDLLIDVKPKLARIFNYILIDAPSVADVSWCPAVASVADGIILIIEAERTRWQVVVNAKHEFENSGAKVLGAFLNKRQYYIPPRIYRYL